MNESDQASRPVTVSYPAISGRPGSQRRPRPALRDTYVNQHIRMLLPDGQPVDLVVTDDSRRLGRPRVGAPLARRDLLAEVPGGEWYFVAAWGPATPPSHNGWGAPAARIKSLVEAAGLTFSAAVACAPDGSWLEINAVIRGAEEEQARQVARQAGAPHFCRLAAQRWDVLTTRQPSAKPISAHARLFHADEPTCPSQIGGDSAQLCCDPGGIAGPAIHASAFFHARRKLGIALLRCSTCANGAGREDEGNFLLDAVLLPTRTRSWGPVDPAYRTDSRAPGGKQVRQLVGIRLESFLTDDSAPCEEGVSR